MRHLHRDLWSWQWDLILRYVHRGALHLDELSSRSWLCLYDYFYAEIKLYIECMLGQSVSLGDHWYPHHLRLWLCLESISRVYYWEIFIRHMLRLWLCLSMPRQCSLRLWGGRDITSVIPSEKHRDASPSETLNYCTHPKFLNYCTCPRFQRIRVPTCPVMRIF